MTWLAGELTLRLEAREAKEVSRSEARSLGSSALVIPGPCRAPPELSGCRTSPKASNPAGTNGNTDHTGGQKGDNKGLPSTVWVFSLPAVPWAIFNPNVRCVFYGGHCKTESFCAFRQNASNSLVYSNGPLSASFNSSIP